MQVVVNGERCQASVDTLGALMTELGYIGNWLATALNGEVVPAGERQSCRLAEGDQIEILAPMKGG